MTKFAQHMFEKRRMQALLRVYTGDLTTWEYRDTVAILHRVWDHV